MGGVGDVVICSFFGHRNIPDCLGQVLKEELRAIIKSADSDITFYVGNKGGFDRLAQRILSVLIKEYPKIKVYVVLDYLSSDKEKCFGLPTIMPDGFENIPRRFAIVHRNKWMINECDFALVYLTEVVGNTRKYVDLLKRKKKTIINIADKMSSCLDNPSNLC